MTKYLLSAAAVALIIGSTGALALEECTGARTGWTEAVVAGGDPVVTCYSGGSGNTVECTDPGNHVVVTQTPPGYKTLTQPGSSPNPQVCIVPNSQTGGGCDITRSGGTGSIDFGYCG
jgi:hypothetical protein